MSKYTDHIRTCLREDAKLQRRFPEDYPPDDEMDYKLLRGEITEHEHRLHLARTLENLEAWFAGARETVDKLFAPYLKKEGK